jgi:hypothetical protein
MHYPALVLVPNETKKSAIPDLVSDMLLPYYVNVLIEPGVYPPNPHAEWDWWRPGGRFDGLLPQQSNNGYASEDDALEPEWTRNMAKVADLPPDLIPAAIITPDGEWHDWYDDVKQFESSEREGKWDQIAKAILSQHRECIAVVVDYHSW